MYLQNSYSDSGTLAIVGADDDSVEIMKLSNAEDVHYQQHQQHEQHEQPAFDDNGVTTFPRSSLFGNNTAPGTGQRRQAHGLLTLG
jgi:hypothetical protein